jgi:hypothetical protein
MAGCHGSLPADKENEEEYVMSHLRAGLRVLALLSLVAFVEVGVPQVSAAGQPHANPNLKTAVPLHDDQTSVSPRLSALCQDFLGQPNPYPNPAPNVDQINGDTVVGVGSQTGCSSPQNETTIVVNPSNPQNLVGGTNDYRVFNTRENRNDSSGWAYASFDGGAT